MKKRVFNSKLEEAYFCAEQGGKPQCLICLEVIGVSKEYNVNRHYKTLHKGKYGRCEGATTLALLYDLKSKLSNKRACF
jgi:hypothetical protein